MYVIHTLKMILLNLLFTIFKMFEVKVLLLLKV